MDRKTRESADGISQAMGEIAVPTRGPGFTDVTREVASWLKAEGAGDGMLTVFCMHTSASLVIQENADPDVRRDLLDALDRFAPQDAGYRHTIEGPDDMPAHIRAMLTSTSIGIPVRGGRPLLGTWQGLYLVEHRTAPHERRLQFHFMGSFAR